MIWRTKNFHCFRYAAVVDGGDGGGDGGATAHSTTTLTMFQSISNEAVTDSFNAQAYLCRICTMFHVTHGHIAAIVFSEIIGVGVCMHLALCALQHNPLHSIQSHFPSISSEPYKRPTQTETTELYCCGVLLVARVRATAAPDVIYTKYNR